ncbi:MAG: hypothetical protein H6581_07725 [Bacteroidia bacterium]|nr:hypothetical protein [Bacteroidia bacterium]
MEEKNVWLREFERHKEVWQASMDAWKATLEEVKLQFSLGQKEALDEFEAQKAKFKDFIQEIKSKVDAEKGLNDEFLTDILAEIDELSVQLALGRAETKELYEAQKKKMLDTIARLKAALENAYGKVNEEWNATIEQFKAKLESLRVQFELGKYEGRDEVAEKKHELSDKLNEFRAQLEAAEKVGKEKMEAFNADLEKSIENLKKSFSDLF